MSDDFKYKKIYGNGVIESVGNTLRKVHKRAKAALVESPPERPFSVFDMEESLKKREKKIKDQIKD